MTASSNSLSPTAIPRTLPLDSPSPPSRDSRSRSPARLPQHPPLSPRASLIFASRPSPVVPSPSLPASPASFSRPTSPHPPISREHSHEPASPTRAGHHQSYELGSSGMLSRSNSQVDLSHVFERDVEFNSTHVISAQEAVDVAIAPVLDEAALALSSASDHQTRDLVREAQGGDDVSTTSGWSSPAGASPVSHPGATQRYANASRSPTRGGAGGAGGSRSFSPSSDGGARATSPGSSTSFSIGTPPDETLHPFSQHLSDALEKTEAARVAGVEGEEQQEHLFSNPSSHPGSHANAAEVVIPAPILAPAPRVATINSSSSHLTMPTPFPIDTSASPAGSIPASPSIEAGAGAGAAKARRLSFLSYADVINEERLAELTGAPAGGEVHSSGGAVDLAGVLNKLELGAEEQRSLGL